MAVIVPPPQYSVLLVSCAVLCYTVRGMTPKKYKLNPDFTDMLAKRQHSLTSFARTYGIPIQTLRAALRPDWHEDRKGYISSITAWRVARAWQLLASIEDENAAFAQVIVIEEQPAP